MKCGLRIDRDGKTVATLTLGPGEHGIGRAPDNAVVLPEQAVSSRHALLRVGDKDVELIDRESLNGIFLDGRKIGRITFAKDLTVDICGFRLSFSPKPDKRSLAPTLPALNLRLSILILTGLLTLAALAGGWLPARSALSDLRQREALRRGALLVRALAEINVLPLRAGLLDQVRVTPVMAEDGVIRAEVADSYGKILAPAKDLGRILDTPEAKKALGVPTISVWTGPSGETMLACPVRDADGVFGLALIALNPDQLLSPVSTAAGALLGLLAAAAAWIAVALFLARLTLRPVRLLSEDIGVALKSGARGLSFAPPSVEYAELKRAAERLLVLVPAAEPDSPPAASRPAGHVASAQSLRTSAPTPTAGPAGAATTAGSFGPTDPTGPSGPTGTAGSAAGVTRIGLEPLPPLPPLPGISHDMPPGAPARPTSPDDPPAGGEPEAGIHGPLAAEGPAGPDANRAGEQAADRVTGQDAFPGAVNGPGAGRELVAGAGGWCLIDLAGFRLTDWSPDFAAHLAAPDLTPPVHLLTALADPAVLAAVAGLLDDPAAEAVRAVDNRPLDVRKRPGATPGVVRVEITERA